MFFYILALDCYDIFNQNKALPGVYDLASIGKVKCLENGFDTLKNKELPVTPQLRNNPHVQSNTNEIDMTSEENVDILQVDGSSELTTGSGYSPFECGTCQQKFADPDDFVIHDSYQFKCHDCHSCFPVRIAPDLHRCNTHRRR